MPRQRQLFDGDRPLRLGSHAFDLLVALVERAGKTVGPDELMSRAWPDTAVDAAALRVNISALRKILGDGRDGNRFIINVPGRGYSFVAAATSERVATIPLNPFNGDGICALPPSVIGRSDVVATLTAQLARHRLVTIIGPGGIGKTTVAAAVSEAARASYADGVWFVGLASLSGSELVVPTLAASLGISLPAADPVPVLKTWLADKHALIVFDNCEHLIDTVATLAPEIVKAAPRLSVLATSREPLRTEGEWRCRLKPLAYPQSSAKLSAADAMLYPAVQLFRERASATTDEFVIGDDDIPAIVQICRRLDGVPLALELAATHVAALGIKGLAARLDDRFALLIQGRRTALPRHQTLRATLDWSYRLLPEAEQVILRRLSVFRGDFTRAAAVAIAADAQLARAQVVNGIANLFDKSLLAVDIGGDVTWYRLLEMTRVYALDRLRESGERERVMRALAESMRALFADSEAGIAERSKDEWVTDYGRQIDNLRAALEWAFSAGGNVVLGVALAAAATNFWVALGLLRECCDWGLRALAQLGAAEGTRDEMILQCGLGQSLTYTLGTQGNARSALIRALTVAEALSDAYYQVRAIYGLWLFALRVSDFQECLALAEKCKALIQKIDDPMAGAVSDFVHGVTHFYFGAHGTAFADLERMRASYPTTLRGGDLVRFGADLPASALAYQALVLWSLGFVEKAFRVGDDAIEEGRKVNHPAPRCISLIMGRSITAVKSGLFEEAERAIEELIDHAGRYSLTPYHAAGLCAKGALAAARGNPVDAEPSLRLGLERARDGGFLTAFYRGEWAQVLASTGRRNQGLTVVDAAIADAEASQALWCLPELLRIRGELLARAVGTAADAAEPWLIRSRELANRQEALSWELRAAISLARHWRDRGRTIEARSVLDGVYRRFTEGLDTADPRAARRLLAELS